MTWSKAQDDAMMRDMTARVRYDEAKTAGQRAYEAELAEFPNYHDGAPRKTWAELPDYAKWSWERNPTPRKALKKV